MPDILADHGAGRAACRSQDNLNGKEREMSVQPNERIERWARKYNVERVTKTLEGMRPAMLANYASAVGQLCAMEIAVKKVLDLSTVHTILYVPYLNFARRLYKLSRTRGVGGDSFALAADVLLKMYTSRGLNPVVLARIRSQVFDIPAPPAP